MKLLNKITVKNLCGDVKKRVFVKENFNEETGELKDGIKIPLMRIAGKCTRFEVKETDLGTSIALKGTFQGIDLATNEVARAPTCYLPGSVADTIAATLAEGASGVEFGFDLYVVTDSSAITSYVYEIVPLMEPSEDDSLNRMFAALPSIPQLLSAPAEAETKAPETKAPKQ
jgi:hypothetical protein